VALENFGLLARRIIERMNLAVVVTGTGGEAVRVEEVVRASSGRAVSLAGQLSVKELAALLQKASLVVANSTGPLHVGVAVGTPVVGLFPRIPVMDPAAGGRSPTTRAFSSLKDLRSAMNAAESPGLPVPVWRA